MGFNLKEPSTFINIKLTDLGRRQLSLGKLTFDKAILSDREVNYSINRPIPSNPEIANYSILKNRILSPVDFHPSFENFDGTEPMPLTGKQVVSAKQFVTATTVTAGMFIGDLNTGFTIDNSLILGFNEIDYSINNQGGDKIILKNFLATNPPDNDNNYYPKTGDLVFIPWQSVQNSGVTVDFENIVSSENPMNCLWYRALTAYTSGANIEVVLDREIPNFSNASSPVVGKVYFYPGSTPFGSPEFRPFNSVEYYYGSAATVDTKVWNMNIIRTNVVEGTLTQDLSEYSTYGSIEYNGIKQYLGFNSDIPAIGVIHYTNEYTGNTYGEQFIEKSFRMNLPTIMWHNNGEDNGLGQKMGLSLTDSHGDTIFDDISKTTYRNLKDNDSNAGKVVGRVYHKLKIIVITDQELLAVMTYKSNRNYTLPKLDLSLSKTPKFPLTNSLATGLCKPDYTYFVTYVVESMPEYSDGESFGFAKTLHCADIARIDVDTTNNGENQFLSAKFPSNAFPFMRDSDNTSPSSPFSGSGWNANKVQLLVNEVETSFGYTLGNLPRDNWRLISTGSGNGIYTGETNDATIDPLKLVNYNFVISEEDYLSGGTYGLYSGITSNKEFLTFGDESFLFGTVNVDILATTYKSIITVFAKNSEFNESALNESYNEALDNDAYITEIGILDAENNLVAIGKPTYPIRKSEGRYIAFQLEIDF
jgi:hypothetical protein